jgi:hypothetical protein
MAERDHLEPTYSLIDRILRVSHGELADFGGAKYDGDFSLSLEEAQRPEHDYVASRSTSVRATHTRSGLRLGSTAPVRARTRRDWGRRHGRAIRSTAESATLRAGTARCTQRRRAPPVARVLAVAPTESAASPYPKRSLVKCSSSE